MKRWNYPLRQTREVCKSSMQTESVWLNVNVMLNNNNHRAFAFKAALTNVCTTLRCLCVHAQLLCTWVTCVGG